MQLWWDIIITKKLNLGGTEKHLLNIVTSLKNKFQIEILVLESGGSLEKYFLSSNIKLHMPVKNYNWLINKFYNLLRIFIIMKNNKNSIFHFFLPEAYLLGGLCGYILKHRFMIMSRRSLNNYQKKNISY